jgi:uncharacterized membrane protein YbhN (UPF0104 family)
VTENTCGAAAGPAKPCQTSWIDALFRKLLFLIPLGVMGNLAFVLFATDGSLFRSEVHFAPGYILLAMFFNGKSVFALTFTLTAVQWICRYSIISLLFMSLGLPARPVLFMALQVVVFALLSFIPTPGGAGGAEALFYLLYRPIGSAYPDVTNI